MFIFEGKTTKLKPNDKLYLNLSKKTLQIKRKGVVVKIKMTTAEEDELKLTFLKMDTPVDAKESAWIYGQTIAATVGCHAHYGTDNTDTDMLVITLSKP